MLEHSISVQVQAVSGYFLIRTTFKSMLFSSLSDPRCAASVRSTEVQNRTEQCRTVEKDRMASYVVGSLVKVHSGVNLSHLKHG